MQMVSSMTAFASRQYSLPQGILRWEIKSVNQRYFETIIKLPDIFQGLEYPLRENLRQKVNRGKIFCHLQYEENIKSSPQLDIHWPLLESLIEKCRTIEQRLENPAPISALDLLKWPHIVSNATPDLTLLHAEVVEAFSLTLQDFLQDRDREGGELKGLITQRLMAMDSILKNIRGRLSHIISLYRERLLQKISEMRVSMDANRLEQEMVFVAQKLDVAEELDRLETHLKAAKTLLEKGGVIGRHLDFLSQELNREANTLASKSVDALLTQETVELKVLIEQIREQVQNIE